MIDLKKKREYPPRTNIQRLEVILGRGKSRMAETYLGHERSTTGKDK